MHRLIASVVLLLALTGAVAPAMACDDSNCRTSCSDSNSNC